jgi:hypothetical protein
MRGERWVRNQANGLALFIAGELIAPATDATIRPRVLQTLPDSLPDDLTLELGKTA